MIALLEIAVLLNQPALHSLLGEKSYISVRACCVELHCRLDCRSTSLESNPCGCYLQDVEVLPLMQRGTIWTMGATEKNIDYVRVWEQRLATDNYKAKGLPFMAAVTFY